MSWHCVPAAGFPLPPLPFSLRLSFFLSLNSPLPATTLLHFSHCIRDRLTVPLGKRNTLDLQADHPSAHPHTSCPSYLHVSTHHALLANAGAVGHIGRPLPTSEAWSWQGWRSSEGNTFAFMPAKIGIELLHLQPLSPDRVLLAWLKLAQGKKKRRWTKKQFLKPFDQFATSPRC